MAREARPKKIALFDALTHLPNLPTYSLTTYPTYSLTQQLIHLLAYLLTYPLILGVYLPTYPLTQLFAQLTHLPIFDPVGGGRALTHLPIFDPVGGSVGHLPTYPSFLGKAGGGVGGALTHLPIFFGQGRWGGRWGTYPKIHLPIKNPVGGFTNFFQQRTSISERVNWIFRHTRAFFLICLLDGLFLFQQHFEDLELLPVCFQGFCIWVSETQWFDPISIVR